MFFFLQDKIFESIKYYEGKVAASSCYNKNPRHGLRQLQKFLCIYVHFTSSIYYIYQSQQITILNFKNNL